MSVDSVFCYTVLSWIFIRRFNSINSAWTTICEILIYTELNVFILFLSTIKQPFRTVRVSNTHKGNPKSNHDCDKYSYNYGNISKEKYWQPFDSLLILCFDNTDTCDLWLGLCNHRPLFELFRLAHFFLLLYIYKLCIFILLYLFTLNIICSLEDFCLPIVSLVVNEHFLYVKFIVHRCFTWLQIVCQILFWICLGTVSIFQFLF